MNVKYEYKAERPPMGNKGYYFTYNNTPYHVDVICNKLNIDESSFVAICRKYNCKSSARRWDLTEPAMIWFYFENEEDIEKAYYEIMAFKLAGII